MIGPRHVRGFVVNPKHGQIQFDLVKRFGADTLVVAVYCVNDPSPRRPEFEDFDKPVGRVDKPYVTDAFSGVNGEFFRAIGCGRARTQHFADPIGCECKKRSFFKSRHSTDTPACEVGYEDVFLPFGTKMNLGFVENDPSPWTAIAKVERTTKLYAEA